MQYTQERLEIFLKEAWSYENRAGWDAEEFETEFLGTLQRENRLYDIYVDTENNYWYAVRVITEKGIVSEYESIFGHPERERRKYRRK